MAKQEKPSPPPQPPRNSTGGFGFVLILIAVGLAVLFALRSNEFRPTGPNAGLSMPELHAAGWINTERPLSTADLRGKVVLLDFWATWCGPCVRGIPELIQLHKKYRDAELVVVGLTSEDGANVQQVRNLVATRTGMDWPIAYGAGLTFQQMNVNAIPMYILYDKSGRSVWADHSLEGIEAKLAQALAE